MEVHNAQEDGMALRDAAESVAAPACFVHRLHLFTSHHFLYYRCIKSMAHTTSFGDGNAGFQAGIVHGPVHAAFNAAPGMFRMAGSIVF